MDILIQLLDKGEITLCQLFLVMERYHLPVGHVDMIERRLTTGIERVLGHLLGDISHLVEGDDTTTHEDGLCKENTTCPDITGISIQGVHNLLTLGIQGLLESCHQTIHVCLQVAHHLLYLCRRHTQLHERTTHLRKRALQTGYLGL